MLERPRSFLAELGATRLEQDEPFFEGDLEQFLVICNRVRETAMWAAPPYLP
jgi:hypothetical protein